VTSRGATVTANVGGSSVGLEGGSGLRRVSSARRVGTSSMAGVKRRSVSVQVKFHMVSLLTPLLVSDHLHLKCYISSRFVVVCVKIIIGIVIKFVIVFAILQWLSSPVIILFIIICWLFSALM